VEEDDDDDDDNDLFITLSPHVFWVFEMASSLHVLSVSNVA